MLSNYVYLLRQSGRPGEAQRLENYLRGRKHAATSGPQDEVVDLTELLTFQRKWAGAFARQPHSTLA